MFMCIYLKASNIVVQIREDSSIPQTTSAQTYFDLFCQSDNINPNDYDFAEIPYQNIIFEYNKYLYDLQSNSIILNPDYVPPPPPPKTWNNESVRAGLTLIDKTKWDNNDTQEIVTAKIEFQTPRERPYTTELLDYLVVSGSISQTSKDRVLAE